ncbi:MAG: hypothetical protein ACJAS1_006705 [Oleiphilaceae bacterium]|jgi:hypothetical protein
MESPFDELETSIRNKDVAIRDSVLVQKLLTPIYETIERFCAGDEVLIVFEDDPSIRAITYLVDHGFLVIGKTGRFEGSLLDIYHKH